MARTLIELKKAMSLSELYKFVKKVALDYAQSSAERARSDISTQYDISQSTYYCILEMAITHGLVNDDQVSKMYEKILAIQNMHGNHGYSSQAKHELLNIKRNNCSDFTKKDIKEIAEFFALHSEMTKADVALHFSLTNTRFLDKILLKACEECIISNKTFSMLESRALKFAKDEAKTKLFFEKLKKARFSFKAMHKKVIPF